MTEHGSVFLLLEKKDKEEVDQRNTQVITAQGALRVNEEREQESKKLFFSFYNRYIINDSKREKQTKR